MATAMALTACTRGGGNASEGTTSSAGVAARDSAAGVVPSSVGGEVMLGPASGAPVPGGPLAAPGLGGSTVVTPPPIVGARSTPRQIAPGTRPAAGTPAPPATGSVRPL